MIKNFTYSNRIALSVIIPCLNEEKNISTQLKALAKQTWHHTWEIIVSDNGSIDNTISVVKNFMKILPNLRIVDASKRKGQPFALNTGVKEAKGDSVVFCDADDEVAPGWVSAMGEALFKYDFIACRTEIKKLNPSWVLKSRKNPQENGVQMYKYPPFLPHAGGGTIGIKKWLFNQVGGFDENFPMLHDTDLCWKVQMKGIKLQFVPEAVIHIKFRDSIDSIFRQACGYGEYNVKIYKKYIPHGMPRISKKESLYNIKKFMLYLYQYIRCSGSLENKAYLAWQVGWFWGRIKGSIKYKVFAV